MQSKTRTDAAKILLDAGWSFEEVQAILGVFSFKNEPIRPIYHLPQNPYVTREETEVE